MEEEPGGGGGGAQEDEGEATEKEGDQVRSAISLSLKLFNPFLSPKGAHEVQMLSLCPWVCLSVCGLWAVGLSPKSGPTQVQGQLVPLCSKAHS